MTLEEGLDLENDLGHRRDQHDAPYASAFADNASADFQRTLLSRSGAVSAIALSMSEAQKPGLYERLNPLRPAGMTDGQWAKAAGLSHQVMTDIKRRGKARHDTIEKLLAVGGHSWAVFDAASAPLPAAADVPSSSRIEAPQVGFTPPPGYDLIATGRPEGNMSRDQVLDIPVLGTADGAFDAIDEAGDVVVVDSVDLVLGEVLERRARPAAWASNRGIYALYTQGDSMHPRFKSGELVYIDPRRPPSIGDDVVVQLRPTNAESGIEPEQVVRALIKELVRRSSDYLELVQYNPPAKFRIPRKAVVALHRVMKLDELV